MKLKQVIGGLEEKATKNTDSLGKFYQDKYYNQLCNREVEMDEEKLVEIIILGVKFLIANDLSPYSLDDSYKEITRVIVKAITEGKVLRVVE